MTERILYCTISKCYGLVKHILIHKWSRACFKLEGDGHLQAQIFPCVQDVHVSGIADSGVIVLLALGITKILCSHEWWLTTAVLALTENAAIVRYANYGFQQRPSWHGSQKPGLKSLPTYSTEPLFIEHCALSTTNVQTQTVIGHKDNTVLKRLGATFSLLWCWGKPKILLGARWVYMFMHYLHKHQLKRKHSLHLTNSHKIDADSCINFLQCMTTGNPTEIASFWLSVV